MPALQVREFPDDIYEELKAAAAREHRSIAQQTIICVERFLREASARERKIENEGCWHRVTPHSPYQQDESLQKREARIAKRQEIFRRIDALPKLDLPNGALGPVDIIQGMREERDTQILGTSLNQVVSSTEEERA
ncbi:MAG: argininosuccinate lyase [Slackia sp.]|uniref:FitA-like ribbon-helix-helix domain-containing protein n=1 Tax=uncultured Slackia sp. TaxID=665903 RepID=UPI00280374A8|nr:argininosuccinate lyase [uncultured Slackia sp.]MDU6010930.1 argininosuccinate lyase [Slackia sp.]